MSQIGFYRQMDFFDDEDDMGGFYDHEDEDFGGEDMFTTAAFDEDRFAGDMNQTVFGNEADAYERAGVGGRLGTSLVGASVTTTDDKRLMRELTTPEDRFKVQVDAIARHLNGDGIADVRNEEIDRMVRAVDSVRDVQYKNATGYILGFLASGGGRALDKKAFKRITRHVLPMVKDSGVEPPDVIRYARYWVTVLP